MIIIQLVSEDFSAQELMEELHQDGLSQKIGANIISAQKEGLSNLHDYIEFVWQNEVGRALVIDGLIRSVGFALKKANEFAFPDPHILVRFRNGQSTKILCNGKSNATIVKELMAHIDEGEVVRVIFKS